MTDLQQDSDNCKSKVTSANVLFRHPVRIGLSLFLVLSVIAMIFAYRSISSTVHGERQMTTHHPHSVHWELERFKLEFGHFPSSLEEAPPGYDLRRFPQVMASLGMVVSYQLDDVTTPKGSKLMAGGVSRRWHASILGAPKGRKFTAAPSGLAFPRGWFPVAHATGY